MLGFGAVGFLADRPYEKETAFMLAEAALTTDAWTVFLKATAGRERPVETHGDIADWAGPDYLPASGPHAFRSFPSGHASRMWAIATVLAHWYPQRGIVPVLGYGTAVAMSYSRMVLGAHWLSDVVVGGMLGYGCARQVLSAHGSDEPGASAPRLQIGIDLVGDYQGIGLTYRL